MLNKPNHQDSASSDKVACPQFDDLPGLSKLVAAYNGAAPGAWSAAFTAEKDSFCIKAADSKEFGIVAEMNLFRNRGQDVKANAEFIVLAHKMMPLLLEACAIVRSNHIGNPRAERLMQMAAVPVEIDQGALAAVATESNPTQLPAYYEVVWEDNTIRLVDGKVLCNTCSVPYDIAEGVKYMAANRLREHTVARSKIVSVM